MRGGQSPRWQSSRRGDSRASSERYWPSFDYTAFSRPLAPLTSPLSLRKCPVNSDSGDAVNNRPVFDHRTTFREDLENTSRHVGSVAFRLPARIRGSCAGR
jgi:hypothetical protein